MKGNSSSIPVDAVKDNIVGIHNGGLLFKKSYTRAIYSPFCFGEIWVKSNELKILKGLHI